MYDGFSLLCKVEHKKSTETMVKIKEYVKGKERGEVLKHSL